MSKRWRIRPHDPDRIAALQRELGVPAVLAQLLIGRGLHEPQHAERFLEARLSHLRDPSELPGVDRAADRITAAIAAGEKICVYGDYDVDGMSGTSLLCRCLSLLGARASFYVPHRLEEGYGLNCDALTTLAGQGVQLVITVDCGITSVREAEHARGLGLDLIITDHHQFGDALPSASAIVHPRLPGTSYPFAGLCGAAVAFKLAWALCQRASGAKRVSERMKDFLLSAVGLTALATIADVVPLVDENRVLVQHGLCSLYERPSVGMAALLRVTKLDAKSCLASDDVAFTLAPRLNAAGRFGQAQLAVELLSTTSAERAQALAEYVHQLNESRQSLERSIYLAANKQAQAQMESDDRGALVLAERGWHAGVIGIVAGRLADKLHRPVVLLALDELGVKPAVGSARSVPGLHLHRALAQCSAHLVSFGGHAAAAGLKIDERLIEAFRHDFCEACQAEQTDETREPEMWIDAEAPLAALSMTTVQQMERLAPFGEGNPRPVLCASQVSLVEAPRKIGGGERHLALKLVQHGAAMRAVCFGGGERADELSDWQRPLSVAFHPVINEFRGRRNVELQVIDWKVGQPAPAPATV